MSVATEIRPVDVFFLLDRSGSMFGRKWDALANGTTAFLGDVFPTRVSASVTVFPPRQFPSSPYAPNQEACNEAFYPAQLSELPQGSAAVVAKILSSPADLERSENEQSYLMLTPIAPALRSVLATARERKAAMPEHEVITVFVSDGLPTMCEPQSSRGIAEIAKKAFEEWNVRTYAVGMQGAAPAFMTELAQAGGSERRYDISADPAAIKNMLRGILFGSIGCAYDLPSPPEGQALDPTRVNTSIERSGSPTELVGAVQRADECGEDKGWYYDNPSSPKQVILCPASCAEIQGDPTVGVNVLFGCTTRLR